MKDELVIVAGLGEVGSPLLRILSRTFTCVGVDIEPYMIDGPCSVLHICYPFQIRNYVEVTANYVREFAPALTVIHSTVPPGTTREVSSRVPAALVAYSPVRGKHARMEGDMLFYRKFVSAPRLEAIEAAKRHLEQAGFKTTTLPTPEGTELAKLLETTYLGVLIAWTQEMERIAMLYNGNFADVNSFVEEVAFLPSHIYPGAIGGHCVLPNIDLLRGQIESPFLELVIATNQRKTQMASEVGTGA